MDHHEPTCRTEESFPSGTPTSPCPDKNDRTLRSICLEAGIPFPPGTADVPLAGITADSRRVRPGYLFVALCGFHTDARRFIPDAVRNGAVAVVAESTEPGSTPESDKAACPPGSDDSAESTEPDGTPEPDGDSVSEMCRLLGVAFVPVPFARVAASCLFDAWYGHPGRDLRLVGVTGTNGKTTVSAMLTHILRTAGIPCGCIGTMGATLPVSHAEVCAVEGHSLSGMTTPDPDILYPLLRRMADEPLPSDGRCPVNHIPRRERVHAHHAPDDRPVVVMEVTSHALLLGKVAPLRFCLSVFTNLTPEHLDIHGTMEDYFASKRKLFEVSREAVVNADSRFGRMLLSEPLAVRHWYICHMGGADCVPPDRLCPGGEGSCSRVYAEQVSGTDSNGVTFRLTSPSARVRVHCPVPGEFTVMNALQASAAALALGVSPAGIRAAMAAFPGVTGRMERVPVGDTDVPFSVFIDFAHTPDALENLLLAVQRFRHPSERIVLVFGCGGDRDPSKRKIMARIASRMADSVVITSDNSRSEKPADIISDILEGMDKESEYAVVPDRAEAIRYVIRHVRAGDIILLSGKGHETYEIDRTGRHPFSEKAVLLEAVREMRQSRRDG